MPGKNENFHLIIPPFVIPAHICHPSAGWDPDPTISMNLHACHCEERSDVAISDSTIFANPRPPVIPACFWQESTLKQASQSDSISFSPGLRPGLLLTKNQRLNTKNYTPPLSSHPSPTQVFTVSPQFPLAGRFSLPPHKQPSYPLKADAQNPAQHHP